MHIQHYWGNVKQRNRLEDLRVLSTGQDIIPARNATDANAKYFVVNDEVILLILKTFAKSPRSLHSARNA